MSGSHAAQIVIPIVVAIALFSWVGAVLWANAHPRYRSRSHPPSTEVAGGAFQAVDGGRQLMPIPEHRPAGWVPAPRAGATAVGQVPQARTGDEPAEAGSEWPAAGTEPAGPTQPLASAAAGGRGMQLGASATSLRPPQLAGLASRTRRAGSPGTAAT
jgi:hypothetical protein